MSESKQVALITGASRGLGLVVARVLAERGYALVITARGREALDHAAAALSPISPRVVSVAGDITDPAVRLQLTQIFRLSSLSMRARNSRVSPSGVGFR